MYAVQKPRIQLTKMCNGSRCITMTIQSTRADMLVKRTAHTRPQLFSHTRHGSPDCAESIFPPDRGRFSSSFSSFHFFSLLRNSWFSWEFFFVEKWSIKTKLWMEKWNILIRFYFFIFFWFFFLFLRILFSFLGK